LVEKVKKARLPRFILPFALTPLLLCFPLGASAGPAPRRVAKLEIVCPRRVNPGISVNIRVRALDGAGAVCDSFEGECVLYGVAASGGRTPVRVPFSHGEAVARRVRVESETLKAVAGDLSAERSVELLSIPPVLSLAPPLLAIVLALITRHVVLSIFGGVWLGAAFLADYNPLSGFLRSLDVYVKNALGDPDHAAIVIFSVSLGGMVGIIARSGGLHAIASAMARRAGSARGAQVATWLMGVAIFFDDYANTLLVGNTMRPFADRLRISREKLAFLVDATAAPVTSLAVISTWVGYEIGLIQESMQSLGHPGARSVYALFIRTVPFRFYSIILLLMVFLLALSGRDFGAMLKAERRSRREGKLLRDGAVPMADTGLSEMKPPEGSGIHWAGAALPILFVVAAVVGGLYYDGLRSLGPAGSGAGAMEILGAADSLRVLLWASVGGSIVAGAVGVLKRVLTVSEAMDAWFAGAKAMVIAMVVLVCAWSLGAVCRDLFTAEYVVDLVSGFMSVALLPAVVFLAAAAISFATGTSWGTMAILMPVVIPLSYNLSPRPEALPGPFLASIAAVLSGSCFGDHASPISDTTILSSMASSCDHVDHVRTQLPYAVAAAAIALLAGFLPAGYGLNPAVSIAVGVGAMAGLVMILGKRTD